MVGMSWFVAHVLTIFMVISKDQDYYLPVKQFLGLIVLKSQVTKSSYPHCNYMYPVNHTMPMFKLFVGVAPLLVFLLWSTVEGGKLHPQWCTFISDS